VNEANRKIDAVVAALDKIAAGLRELASLRVVRSRKFASDYGEWLVSRIFGGSLAPSKTQKGWDVRVGDERIQVRTHSKAPDNPNRWSSVKGKPDGFDSFVVVILDESFRVAELY